MRGDETGSGGEEERGRSISRIRALNNGCREADQVRWPRAMDQLAPRPSSAGSLRKKKGSGALRADTRSVRAYLSLNSTRVPLSPPSHRSTRGFSERGRLAAGSVDHGPERWAVRCGGDMLAYEEARDAAALRKQTSQPPHHRTFTAAC